ncbi:MAG: hypothetical protein IKV16_04790, partial [Clostridia bacterium]|nr:hypothetical protein [Clostridia bacterium]
MKRVLAILLVVMLCVLALASCTTGGDAHVHTFKETWTSDASGHWYDATCECEDVEIIKLAHSDKNNDGVCDICEFKTACSDGHTYDEGWTADCTQHWNAADCGHIVAGANAADHVDENADGRCDVCNYVIKDIHVHYYDDEWSSDAVNHWHAALCEHGVEVADKAAHNVNAAGFCTVCGAKVKDVDKTSIAAILNAAIANNDKVVIGSVIAGEYEFSGAGEDMYRDSASTEEIYFVLGNGTAYHFWKTFVDGEFFGGDEYWYELVGEDQVEGISKVYGDYRILPVDGEMKHLNGYTYNPGSILPTTEDDTSTLASLLSEIYAIKTAGVRVVGATENYDAKTGIYSFIFSYHIADKID